MLDFGKWLLFIKIKDTAEPQLNPLSYSFVNRWEGTMRIKNEPESMSCYRTYIAAISLKLLDVPKFQWLQHIQTCQMLIRLDPGLVLSLQRRHYERGGVLNHRRLDYLLDRLFRSKKTPKLRVTGLCEENAPANNGVPSQRASNAENNSSWWRHHVISVHDMIDILFGGLEIFWNINPASSLCCFLLIQYWPRVSNILCLEHKLGTFMWMV